MPLSPLIASILNTWEGWALHEYHPVLMTKNLLSFVRTKMKIAPLNEVLIRVKMKQTVWGGGGDSRAAITTINRREVGKQFFPARIQDSSVQAKCKWSIHEKTNFCWLQHESAWMSSSISMASSITLICLSVTRTSTRNDLDILQR
jgi:hypothetical protein